MPENYPQAWSRRQTLSAINTRCAEIDLALGRNADAVEDADNALHQNPGNRKLEANLAFVKARAGR